MAKVPFKAFSIVAALVVFATTLTMNTASWFLLYTPKTPKSLLK
jgi:cyclic lactone autoinducer peptide